MNDNDIAYKLAMESAERSLKTRHTREEALRSLMRAGILDKNGNFTEPYKELAKVVKKYHRNEEEQAEVQYSDEFKRELDQRYYYYQNGEELISEAEADKRINNCIKR